MDSRLCRAGNLPADGIICKYHHRKLQLNDNFCSSPLESHSGRLRRQPIPERLFDVFDEIGKSKRGYRRGNKWCQGCTGRADSALQDHPRYEPPSKRTPTKKLWTITLNCLLLFFNYLFYLFLKAHCHNFFKLVN